MTDIPRWQDYLKTLPQYLLPQRGISHALHFLAQSRIPWIKNILIKSFIRAYHVEMNSAEISDPEKFEHFNAFFTRRLLKQARPMPEDGNCIACPVDGSVSQIGVLRQSLLLQIKNHVYDLNRLLPQSRYVDQFNNGAFATLYLSPRDYHRVHCPWEGQLMEVSYEPGSLFAVNPSSVKTVRDLFCRNERVVCVFRTSLGMMAVIMVGAFLVGSIETVWHGTYSPPHARQKRYWEYTKNPIRFQRGEELGHFKMGSTVIVLFESGKIHWSSQLESGSELRMGQSLGKPVERV